MARIDQLLVLASAGDPITVEALRLRDELSRSADSEIFAWVRDLPQARPVEELDTAGSPARELLIQQPAGVPLPEAFLARRSERLTLRAHDRLAGGPAVAAKATVSRPSSVLLARFEAVIADSDAAALSERAERRTE